MQVNYNYPSPSMCIKQDDKTLLGLSPDLSREEKVSFIGKLKHPLVFRDAMLMLRQIVISDMSQQKKERVEFFSWLEEEISRRMLEHNEFLPGIREELKTKIDELELQISKKNLDINELSKSKNSLQKEIDKYDIWNDYNKIERKFWQFIHERDSALWWVLDPVITVHKDQVSFEAFSLDESSYGCLSVDMNEFDLVQEPQLGTTNIDFSSKLAKEMERFRTYTDVELSVNPDGFTVDTGVTPEHIEKKIDLPETWIKGFTQVSSAASLGGIDIELSPIDFYDICSLLRRNKARKSPRYMKWILDPGKHIKIIFEPFGKTLELKAIYNGKKKREEKIWGRRRWLIIERIIPIAKSFTVRFLGFGMPQFIIANLGLMKMTIGFTSWSSNDWVKGTSFNIMAGYIGSGNYDKVYTLLKENRSLNFDDIYTKLNDFTKNQNKSGIGMLLRKGEGYFDPINDSLRFRQLCNTPIPEHLYSTTTIEKEVDELLKQGLTNYRVNLGEDKEFIAKQSFDINHWRSKKSETEIKIDQDGQISSVKCKCSKFLSGAKNISSPCSHILALYVTSSKFLHLELEPNFEYTMNDILEMLL